MRILAGLYHLLALAGLFFIVVFWYIALAVGVKAVEGTGETLSDVALLITGEGPLPFLAAFCVVVTVGIVLGTERWVRKFTHVADSFRVLAGCIALCFLGLAILTFRFIATDFRHLPFYPLKTPDAALRPYRLFALAFAGGACWLGLYLWSRKTACLGLFFLTPTCVAAIVLCVYPGEFLSEVYRMELPAAYPTIENLGVAFAILVAAWLGLRWLWRWVAGRLSVEAGSGAAVLVAGVWAWVILVVGGAVLTMSWWYSSCSCIRDSDGSHRWVAAELFLIPATLWGGILIVQWLRYRRLRREETAAQNSTSAVTG